MRAPVLIRVVRCGVWLVALLSSAAIVGPALARDSVSHVAVAPAVRFLHVDGAKIAYRDFNSTTRGTPLLMIVGYGDKTRHGRQGVHSVSRSHHVTRSRRADADTETIRPPKREQC
jgi:hypothetical protein